MTSVTFPHLSTRTNGESESDLGLTQRDDHTHDSISNSTVALLNYLNVQNGNPNWRDSRNVSLICKTINNPVRLRLLLNARANPNPASHLELNPLALAASSPNPDSFDLLVRYGADPDAVNEEEFHVMTNAVRECDYEEASRHDKIPALKQVYESYFRALAERTISLDEPFCTISEIGGEALRALCDHLPLPEKVSKLIVNYAFTPDLGRYRWTDLTLVANGTGTLNVLSEIRPYFDTTILIDLWNSLQDSNNLSSSSTRNVYVHLIHNNVNLQHHLNSSRLLSHKSRKEELKHWIKTICLNIFQRSTALLNGTVPLLHDLNDLVAKYLIWIPPEI